MSQLCDKSRRRQEDYSLFVTNLPIELNEDGIEKIFKKYGKVTAIISRNEGQFAFISYEAYSEAENAISSLDDKPPLYLKVKFRKKSVESALTKSDENVVNFQLSNDKAVSKSEELSETPVERRDVGPKATESDSCAARVSRIEALHSKIPPRPIDSPYENGEYAETNALWSRGCMTMDAAGRKHVMMGRGHTFYHIPEQHPKIIDDIQRVYEKRHARYYEYGFDQCKEYVGKCMYCLKHATLCCSLCDGFYCTRDCQIADWSKHQALCKKIPSLVNANYPRESLPGRASNSISELSRRKIRPESVVFKERQQQVLRRPKLVTDSNENILNVGRSEAVECGAAHGNQQKDAVNCLSSSLPGDNREKVIHDGAFEFKRVDKISEESWIRKFLSPLKFIDVEVTVTKEPGKLYFVQKIEDSEKITRLMEEINENIEKFKVIRVPVIQKIYGVIYDNIWHRGLVLSLSPLIIDYVDYGTITEVPGNMNMRDIGNLADIPRFSQLIRLPEKFANKTRNLIPNSVISVKMIDVEIDPESGNGIINVDMPEENLLDNSIIVTDNNHEEVHEPCSIINSLTVGMTILAEISDVIDENTATAVLSFDAVYPMFERLLNPLTSDCNENSLNYVNYKPHVHEFVCIQKPGDAFWYRGCVLKVRGSQGNSLEMIEVASLDEGVIITQVERIVPLMTKYNEISIFSAIIKNKLAKSEISFGKPHNCVQLQITEVECLDKKNSINSVKAILKNELGISGEVQLYQWTPWNSDPIVETTELPEESPGKAENEGSVVDKNLLSHEKILIRQFELANHTKIVIQSYRSPSFLFLRSLEPHETERHNCLIQNIAKAAQTSSHLDLPPETGDYVLAQYVDDNYYRAMVLAVEQDNEKIKIVYIDYGNREITTLKKLKIMPESLMSEPCCTKKVVLKGIKPSPSTKEAIEYLANLVANEVPLICDFACPGSAGSEIILRDTSGNSINDQINDLLTPSWEKVIPQREENSVSNVAVEQDGDKIPMNIMSTENFSLNDIEIGNFGNIGDTISALFLDIIEPGLKYVFALEDREMMVHITSVMPATMKRYCESTDYYIPRDNELCIALFEDNNWYRGCCFKSTTSSTSALIYFLDFGNLAMVLHKNIRRMTTDFLKPGTFGCICNVDDFGKSPTDVSPQVLSRLGDFLIPNETYKVEIIGFDGDEYTIKLPDIRSKLIEENLPLP